MTIARELIATLVNDNAIAHNLRPDIVMCILIQETGGDVFAGRFEKDFYEAHLRDSQPLSGWTPAKGTVPTMATERCQRAWSWGLMQVLGDTARWCAKCTYPYLTKLSDPAIGIDVGCRVLSYYLGRAKGDYRAALKGYNGSWEYADEVLARVARGEHLEWFRSS